MITLLTCTGDRPELFRRQERWMVRQSMRWQNWIVVDDGDHPTECTLDQKYIRLPPGLPPTESFARNLRTALHAHAELRGSEFVFMIEDDDWYGPHYVTSLMLALLDHDLAGESYARYYNVSQRSYYFCRNTSHASLCSTAFRAALIPRILPLIDDEDALLDIRIWSEIDCSKHLQRTRHSVGLKGQSGRSGLTWAHDSGRFRADPDGVILRQWLGRDANEVLTPVDGD